MSDKAGLASLVAEVTGGIYPEPAVKMRNRVGVDGRFLQRRRSLTTPQDLAKFIILLFASIPHVGAAAAAARVSELRNPTHEAGSNGEWSWLYSLTFLEALTRLVEEIQTGNRHNLLGISICATHPESAIYFLGANGSEEAYRFYDGTPRARFRTTLSDYRDVSGLLIQSVALYGSENSSDEGGNGPASDADMGDEAGTSEPNDVPKNENAAPGRAALVKTSQPGAHPTEDYTDSESSVCMGGGQHPACIPAGFPGGHRGRAESIFREKPYGPAPQADAPRP
jgi:hypothetical protein